MQDVVDNKPKQQQLVDTENLRRFSDLCSETKTAITIADAAHATGWEIEAIIDLWEEHRVLSPKVKKLSLRQYNAFQEGEELYQQGE